MRKTKGIYSELTRVRETVIITCVWESTKVKERSRKAL